MSGASGAVPAAIHMTPGADQASALARLQDGDRILLDADAGTLDVMVDPSELAARACAPMPAAVHGWGRELFAPFRAVAGDAEAGGGIFNSYAGG
jgi:phosphogluconate dehydratase